MTHVVQVDDDHNVRDLNPIENHQNRREHDHHRDPVLLEVPMSWLDDAEKRHAEIPGAGNYADLGIALTILRRAMKTTADTIVLLEHGTSPSEVDEWRDTARSEMAGRRAAEAQVQRLLTTMEHQGVILKAQRARTEHAEAALRELVRGIDDWDAAVGQIIKRPINHKWAGLERARALLGDTASTCRCGHSMEAHRCAEPGCKRGCHANDGSDGPCDCALRDPAPAVRTVCSESVRSPCCAGLKYPGELVHMQACGQPLPCAKHTAPAEDPGLLKLAAQCAPAEEPKP